LPLRLHFLSPLRVLCALFAALAAASTGAVFALESSIPTNWENSPCFTTQSWEFKAVGWDDGGQPIAPRKPYTPDGKDQYINAYGLPHYLVFGPKELLWRNTPGGEKGWTRHGFWTSEDSKEPFGLEFIIPTGEPAGKKRKLWLCYDIAKGEGTAAQSRVFTEKSKPFTVIYRVDWELPSSVGNVVWRRVVEEWLEDEPTTSDIKVHLEFAHGSAMIDHVKIATGCITAPGTMPPSGTRPVDFQNQSLPFSDPVTNK
jgi:hypothetical protein